MIRFACRRCGQQLEVADDQAGSALQCLNCGLLNDAPSFSDKERLAEDGTFALDEAPAPPPPQQLAELFHTFSRYDQQGNQIDHRGPIVSDENPYELAGEADPELKPKYDPDTGELIRPHEVRQGLGPGGIDPLSIPLARPALNYASGHAARRAGLHNVPLDLLRPINLAIIGFIFIAQVFLGFLMYLTNLMNFPVGVPMFLAFEVMLLAHWGNIVDEVGCEGRNEIPRPFRDLRFYEDIWHPFWSLAMAVIVCYAPGRLVLLVHGPQKIVIGASIGVELIATFFFPAIFLTLCNSGSLANLHPKRVLGVIGACGSGYAIVVLAWTLAIVPYFWPNLVICIVWHKSFIRWIPWWGLAPQYVVPALALGTFLMHWFCWSLGLLHSAYSSDFPWVNQYHVRANRDVANPAAPRPKLKLDPGGSADRARALNGRPARRQTEIR